MAIGLRLATVSGLGVDAERAQAKLDRLLPGRLTRAARRIAETTDVLANAFTPSDLDSLTSAIERHERLRFEYRAGDGEASSRDVEPYRVVQVSGRWYLVGFDMDRSDWRTFRVDRMTPKIPSGPRFAPRRLPPGDPSTMVLRGRRDAMFAYRADVLVLAAAAVVHPRIPTGVWWVDARDDDSATLHAGAQTAQLLAAYLAAMDLDFQVDSDRFPELANEVAAIARRFARAHAPEPTDT